MATEEFAAGIERLERLASERLTAVMCAEADWRRCHRQLIADASARAGPRPVHLLADGRREVTGSARTRSEAGLVSYPGQPQLEP